MMLKPEEHQCLSCGEVFKDVDANPTCCPICGAKFNEYSSEDADGGHVYNQMPTVKMPPEPKEIEIQINVGSSGIDGAELMDSSLKVNRPARKCIKVNRVSLSEDGYLSVDGNELLCGEYAPIKVGCSIECGYASIEPPEEGKPNVIHICYGDIIAKELEDYRLEEMTNSTQKPE